MCLPHQWESHYSLGIMVFYAKNVKQLKYYEIRYPHKRTRKEKLLAKDYGGKKSMIHPFGPLVSDVWTDIHRIKHNKFRDEHPCQLPIHLLERIILMSTDEGDIVLDPFNGTGTTAIAAKRLGRQFIGFDLDAQYVEITKKKLEFEEPISKIGDRWVSFYLDEVVTLRNDDWDYLKEFFYIPPNAEDVDKKPIILKTKIRIKTPQKNLITINGNVGNECQIALFEPSIKYNSIERKTNKKQDLNKLCDTVDNCSEKKAVKGQVKVTKTAIKVPRMGRQK